MQRVFCMFRIFTLSACSFGAFRASRSVVVLFVLMSGQGEVLARSSFAVSKGLDPFPICLDASPTSLEFTMDRCASRFRAGGPSVTSIARGATGKLRMGFDLEGGAPVPPKGFAEITLSFDRISRQKFKNIPEGAELRVEVYADDVLVGRTYRSHRVRIFLEDIKGRRAYLENHSVVRRPVQTQGWVQVSGILQTQVTAPLGWVDEGFDQRRVAKIGLNLEPAWYWGESFVGELKWRNLKAAWILSAPRPRVHGPDPILARQAPLRKQRMATRVRNRTGRDRFVGINLAWPSVEVQPGEFAQLYGSYLDAPFQMYGETWDLRNPKVQNSLRRDFREIRKTFGRKPVVRMFLFTDLSYGIEFDDQGWPQRLTPTAVQNVGRLLDIAQQEGVVLIPVLMDFLMADGKGRPRSRGAGQVGEHPDLIIEAPKRSLLFKLFEMLISQYAGHPAVLVWDLINEPENATAVNRLGTFGEFQDFLREGVEMIHSAGELATIGHRHIGEAKRFADMRFASDLGQYHFYPQMETRQVPFDLDYDASKVFSESYSGWGETPLRPGRVFSDLEGAFRAGHRFVMFWSWRSDDPSGDGLYVRRHRAELERAIKRLGLYD